MYVPFFRDLSSLHIPLTKYDLSSVHVHELNGKGTENFQFISNSGKLSKILHTPNFLNKKFKFLLNKSSNYIYKEIFAPFLKKIAQNILQISRKGTDNGVHLVRNELSSTHIHFSLLKSDQHSVHECELNVN